MVAKQVQPKKTGRPPKRSPELAKRICSLMCAGHSLNRVISGDFGFKCARAFIWEWIQDDPSFAMNYAYAREMLADHYVDEIVHLIDQTTPENAVANRAKIDGLKWISARFFPRVYGDRPMVEINNTTNNLIVSEPQRLRILEQLARLDQPVPKLT